MTRLAHIIRKEFLELRQDPRLFGIVIIAPIIQLTMLGYAATTDVRNVPLVVVDQDRSGESRELVSRFDASPSFDVIDGLTSTDGVDAYLNTGKSWMTAPTRIRRTSRSAMRARSSRLMRASWPHRPASCNLRSYLRTSASGSTRSSR